VIGWTDFANLFSAVFLIVRTWFKRPTVLRKSTGKVGNLDVKNPIVAPFAQENIN